MLLSLARIFFLDPLLDFGRFVAGEGKVAVGLLGKVFHPDPTRRPTEETILATAREFFRFLSYWVIVQVSALELSGTDSDLVAEAAKYLLLLGTYVLGFAVNYGVVFLAKLWSRHDFLTSVDVVANFYNLFFWFAFLINLVLGKIDVHAPNVGGVHLDVLHGSYVVVGVTYFVILRVRKIPMHGFTWLCVLGADFLLHTFNAFLLSEIVYEVF